MSKNILLIAVFGIVIIGGSVYYALNNKRHTPIQKTTETARVTPVEQIIATTAKEDTSDLASTHKKDASSDEIINYIVDDLASDESKAFEITLTSTSTSSSDIPTIGTNF